MFVGLVLLLGYFGLIGLASLWNDLRTAFIGVTLTYLAVFVCVSFVFGASYIGTWLQGKYDELGEVSE
jgi:hypothetical protein